MLKRCILPYIAFLLFRYINIPLNANNAKMNRLNALYGIMRIHNANIAEKKKRCMTYSLTHARRWIELSENFTYCQNIQTIP